jgi:hypothetical protein
MKKPINVRDYKGDTFNPAPETVETVARTLYPQQIGNFCPVFCRYKGRTYQVQSEAGDLSDPFRADGSYLETLYIDLARPCQWSL